MLNFRYTLLNYRYTYTDQATSTNWWFPSFNRPQLT